MANGFTCLYLISDEGNEDSCVRSKFGIDRLVSGLVSDHVVRGMRADQVVRSMGDPVRVGTNRSKCAFDRIVAVDRVHVPCGSHWNGGVLVRSSTGALVAQRHVGGRVATPIRVAALGARDLAVGSYDSYGGGVHRRRGVRSKRIFACGRRARYREVVTPCARDDGVGAAVVVRAIGEWMDGDGRTVVYCRRKSI